MPELIVEPTPPSNNLSELTRLRLSPEDDEWLIAQAAREGLAVSAFVRQVLKNLRAGKLVWRRDAA
jgi:hypothetical protein